MTDTMQWNAQRRRLTASAGVQCAVKPISSPDNPTSQASRTHTELARVVAAPGGEHAVCHSRQAVRQAHSCVVHTEGVQRSHPQWHQGGACALHPQLAVVVVAARQQVPISCAAESDLPI